jgi:(p)ppGpp synthase/HD superfamily hydrolase
MRMNPRDPSVRRRLPPDPLTRAIILAAAAHAKERGRGGDPKLLHVLRVMLRVDDPEERVAAALHDVVEEEAATLSDLQRAGFSRRVVRLVDLLTRRGDEDYFDYIRRLCVDPAARRIKLADLADNTEVRRHLKRRTSKDREKIQRFARARRMILKCRAARPGKSAKPKRRILTGSSAGRPRRSRR